MTLGELFRQPASKVMDLAPVPLAAADEDGRIVYVNPALCRAFGVPCEQIIGRIVQESLPAEERARFLDCLASWNKGEVRLLRVSLPQHEALTPFLIGPGPLLDPEGRVLGIMCAVLPAREVDAVSEAARFGLGALARSALRGLADQLDETLRALSVGAADLSELRQHVSELRRLSQREWEVACRIGQSERTDLVAEQLGIRPSTVRNHLKAIFRKTGVNSQAALVKRFREWRRELSQPAHRG